MPATTIVLFLIGFVLLIVGAEMLVRGSSRLATAMGISPLVVGLTVVAFGTSAPELAVSVQSAYGGQASLAIGNVVGSNILNVLLILGLAALILPLTISQQLIRLDVPLMIAASFALYYFARDGAISRVEGIILATAAILYTVFCVVQSRRESAAVKKEYAEEYMDQPAERHSRGYVPLQLGLIVGGLGALLLGSNWLVSGAVEVAKLMGVSELVIGLTIIAVGTSMPEIATTVMASLRGEREIAVGNVVGSNLFNILMVLGLTGTVAPSGVPVPAAAIAFDIPVMIAVAVACLPVFFNGGRIHRWEGALFLGYYVAYTAYLLLAVAQHAALPAFSVAMVGFALPLTAVTLGVVTWNNVRANRKRVAAERNAVQPGS
jgi:cation:H+ antiporter